MRQMRSILLLIVVTALLGGCVYDPYTGAYYPCCSYYGYPYRTPYPAYYGAAPYPAYPGYAAPGYAARPVPQPPPPPPLR